MPQHIFKGSQEWTGNLGTGTNQYEAYSRNFEITTAEKHKILGSADPQFRGEAARINPEDFLLNALSTCHMLWYFHLCADHGIVVISYKDSFEGEMEYGPNTNGGFISATLNPTVEITSESNQQLAIDLHHEAHKKCFIANSVNFPILCNPTVKIDVNR